MFYFFKEKEFFLLIFKFRKRKAVGYHSFCMQAGCIFNSMIGWTLQHRKILSFHPNSLIYFPIEITSYSEGVTRDINVVDEALSSLGKSSISAGSYSGVSAKITFAMQTSASGLWAHVWRYPLSISVVSAVLWCIYTCPTHQEFVSISIQGHLQNQLLLTFSFNITFFYS